MTAPSLNRDRATFYDRKSAEADWDQWTNKYETRRRLQIIFDDLLATTELEGRTLLDAGSGGGHFSQAACERGARVTSLDVGENVLAQVAKRCDSTRIVGSVLELPFPDSSFDVVLSTEVVEHTTDPLKGVREFARVVKPGGLVLLTTPGRLWQPVVRLASVLHLRPYQGYENFVWPHAAKAELERAGVDVQRFFGFNLLPLFKPVFDPFHRVADRVGSVAPWLCVNFAILGTKTS
jgi:2-polyprenyl-3-methyl-5-hydroxy-6-metoxy-1,4-benzoquinol methylase